MSKTIIAVVVVVLVVVSGYFLLKKDDASPSPSPTYTSEISATPEQSVQGSTSVTPNPSITSQSQVKSFTVSASNYSFSMSEIKVNKGDTVKITFNNQEGMHDWVLDEFNAKTPRIQSGQSVTVTFVADKVGTFEYYCSVGNHRAMGMKGNLIVQ